MAFAFVAGTSDPLGVNGGTSTGIDTSTGSVNLIVLGIVSYAPAAVVTGDITDNKSNTYTAVVPGYTANEPIIKFFYKYSPAVGTGHTVTVSHATSYCAIVVGAFSGAASSPLDLSDGDGTASSVASIDPASGITPSGSGALVLSAGTNASGDVGMATPSGYTIIDNEVLRTTSPTDNFGIHMAYKIIGAPGLEQPNWVANSGTAPMACIVASFLAASTGRFYLLGGH